MPDEIREDEWLAELERLEREGLVDGVTVRELAAACCLDPDVPAHLKRIRRALKRGMRKGTVVFAGRSNREAMDGVMRRVPVYRITRRDDAE